MAVTNPAQQPRNRSVLDIRSSDGADSDLACRECWKRRASSRRRWQEPWRRARRRLRDLRRQLETKPAPAGDSGGARHLRQRRPVRPVPDRNRHPHSGLAGGAIGADALRQPPRSARRAGGGDFAIGRIDRHQRRAGGRAQPRGHHGGDHQRAQQHYGGNLRLYPSGASRQGRERCRDQDLHLPASGSLPARPCARRRSFVRRAAPSARMDRKKFSRWKTAWAKSPSVTCS